MKTIAIAFVLLLSSFSLFAQSSTRPESQAVVFRDHSVGNDCPISMRASQGVWDHTIRVHQGQKDNVVQPFGQRIFLTLNDTRPAPIVAATVRVHGLTARSHMVQADGNANAKNEATKIIELTFAANQNNGVTGDLYIPGFTAVNSIELLQVSYSDGRLWRIGPGGACHVTPDPMMLIANH